MEAEMIKIWKDRQEREEVDERRDASVHRSEQGDAHESSSFSSR